MELDVGKLEVGKLEVGELEEGVLGLKLTWCQPFASRAFQSPVTQICAHKKNNFEGFFLQRIDFPGQLINFCMSHIF